MKFVSILIICALACDQSAKHSDHKNISLEQTTSKLGIKYYKDVPFSGTIHDTTSQNIYKIITEYRDGKKHGKELAYYNSNTLFWERFYKNGEKQGHHRAWWPNGQLKFSFNFENGLTHGKQMEWYKSGKKLRIQNFELGSEIGLQQSWRENGKLRANYIVKNGRTYGVVKSRLCYNVKDGKGKFK